MLSQYPRIGILLRFQKHKPLSVIPAETWERREDGPHPTCNAETGHTLRERALKDLAERLLEALIYQHREAGDGELRFPACVRLGLVSSGGVVACMCRILFFYS